MNPALVDLMMQLEQARWNEARAFVVVTVDLDTSQPINASGPYEQAEQAFAQAGRDQADWDRSKDCDEGDVTHMVVPLWEPGK